MKSASFTNRQRQCAVLTVLAFTLAVACGCRNQAPAPRTDQQIAADIQSRIKGESALSGQNIQVSVVDGIATLSGVAADNASRALAAADSALVAGVKTVVNNLTVQPPAQAVASVAPAPSVAPPAPRASKPHRQVQVVQEQSPPPQVAPPPPPVEAAPMVAAAAPPPPLPPPPAPPTPVVRQITLPEGTTIPVRISEQLSSKDAHANDVFHGSLAGDLAIDGVVAIPQGAAIMGRVIDAKDAAHFKGDALLSLELTQVMAGGKKIALVTDPYSKQGPGRGKNTVEKSAGGGLFGAVVGALAGGGRGAAIGTLAGAAAGTGVNAATRGQQVVLPTETLIDFQLKSPVTLTVTTPAPQGANAGQVPEPQLQKR